MSTFDHYPPVPAGGPTSLYPTVHEQPATGFQNDERWVPVSHQNMQGHRRVIARYANGNAYENRGVTTRWAEETTLHGPPYFIPSYRNAATRIVWLVVFLVCAGVCVYIVWPQFQQYIDGVTRTSTTTITDTNVAFPGLTICNTNNFRKSIIGQSPVFVKVIQTSYYPNSTIPIYSQSTCSQGTTANAFSSLLNDVGLFFQTYLHYGMFAVCPDSYQGTVRGTCKFDGRAYDCWDMFVNHMVDNGFCFTFNPGSDLRTTSSPYTVTKNMTVLSYPDMKLPLFEVRAGGPTSGLDVVLNAQHYDYCDAGGKGAVGFKMIVHNPEVVPMFKAVPSISLTPGYDTVVSVQLHKVRHNTKELGRCVDTLKLDYYPNATTYYQNQCFSQCYSKFLESQCNCTPKAAPNARILDIVKKGAITSMMCVTLSNQMCTAVADAVFFNNASLQAQCPECMTACDELFYETVVTQQMFPADNYMQFYMDKKYPNVQTLPSRLIPPKDMLPTLWDAYLSMNNLTGNFTDEFEVRKNLLRLRIYVTSLSFLQTVEDPVTTLEDLVCQVGGAMGLFLGASILSIFELLYWCFVGAYVTSQKRQAINKKMDEDAMYYT